MAYQVLARKWRPQVFEDVVGQEHITDVLKNSIETGRLHHGYLFSGIRGIGKTTTSRILAKALNCISGPTPQPCNQCEFCREITEGYSMDVVEIDGASNRGVDDVRILRENSGYAPARSRYKVFIIDEVHMLTTEAFNALLKTLEEPPPNVVFMMATTEPWKIPPTVLSRCQQFTFKNGSAEDVVRLLKKLARHERVAISDASLALLAKTAGGSVRDAENLLDQVIGFCGEDIQDREVRYVLGIPDQALLEEFLMAVLEHRSPQIFTLLEQLVNQGANLRLFCMELMERVRNLMVLTVAGEPERYLSLFDYTRKDLERYMRHAPLSVLQQLYWLLVRVERDMRFSPNPRFILEMALARMTHVRELAPIPELSRQLQDLQSTLAQSGPKRAVHPPRQAISQVLKASQTTVSQVTAQAPEPESIESPPPLPSQEVLRLWEVTLAQVKKRKMPLAVKLKNAVPVNLNENEFVLGFHPDASVSREAVEEPANLAILAEELEEQLGRKVQITTMTHHGAVSVDLMQQQLNRHAESIPRPEPSSGEYKAKPKTTPEPRSRSGNSEAKGKGKNGGNWQKRQGANQLRYKAPVQVSVQDVVRLFEGKIEE